VSNVSIGYLAALLAVLAGSACTKSEKAGTDASTDASADASTSTSTSDGRALVAGACLSCHSEHMLAQQRLTQAQWSKVVTKMVGWGANLEPTEVGPLVSYLSTAYGPDAGLYEAGAFSASEAPEELAEASDDPIPAGDAARGRTLFIDKCSGCHGADARGHIGVALVDRPLLYRASDVARVIRRGRGKMLPIALSGAEIGDVLAHLRSLRNAPP